VRWLHIPLITLSSAGQNLDVGLLGLSGVAKIKGSFGLFIDPAFAVGAYAYPEGSPSNTRTAIQDTLDGANTGAVNEGFQLALEGNVSRTHIFGTFEFDCRSGLFNRRWYSRSFFYTSTPSISRRVVTDGVWEDSSTVLSYLRLRANAANGLRAGSWVQAEVLTSSGLYT
jgi:hypothetical protein